jgi:hypothetical protein
MTQTPLSKFRTVWFIDFEFRADPGERPHPVCLVARELWSNRMVRQWLTDGTPKQPPFDVGLLSPTWLANAGQRFGPLRGIPMSHKW